MSLVIKALHASKNTAIAPLLQSVHLWVRWRLGIKPLLDFNEAGTVVELVGCICCLLCETADLTNEGYLLNLIAVNDEFGVRVGLVGVDELLDGYWAERVFPVSLNEF